MAIGNFLASLLNSSGLVPLSKINATGTPGGSNFLRGDGSWNTPVTLAYDRQTFNASGTWTKPLSGTYAHIQIWGSGGAGQISFGGGGGGGYTSVICLLSDLAATVSVTINAGGSSSAANGGSITFGSYLTQTGGGGGSNYSSGCSTFALTGRSGYLSASTGLTLIHASIERSTNNAVYTAATPISGTIPEKISPNVFAPGSGGTSTGTQGTSVFGGNGNFGSAGAGVAPGGGGGGGGATAGSGAIGRVIVTVF